MVLPSTFNYHLLSLFIPSIAQKHSFGYISHHLSTHLAIFITVSSVTFARFLSEPHFFVTINLPQDRDLVRFEFHRVREARRPRKMRDDEI